LLLPIANTSSSEVLQRPLESAQYLAIRYTERVAEIGAVRSVGSRGDSYDNALAESVIGLYKTELIRPRGPWRGIDDVELATLEWIDWWNHRRLLEPIGWIPPAEAETSYYSQGVAASGVGTQGTESP
jgi:transposase InsO family protein